MNTECRDIQNAAKHFVPRAYGSYFFIIQKEQMYRRDKQEQTM